MNFVIYLFQLTEYLEFGSNCFDGPEVSMMQYSGYFNITLTSELAIGSSRVLPKLLKYFNSANILTSPKKNFFC